MMLSLLIMPTLILAEPLIDANATPDTSLKVTLPSSPLNQTLDTVASYVIGILVLVAVFYIIRAGYEFVTANGDQEKISQARSSIMYAAIGIIIALIAKGIVNFIVGAIGK